MSEIQSAIETAKHVAEHVAAYRFNAEHPLEALGLLAATTAGSLDAIQTRLY
jgi:hypothetical protein